MKIKLEEFEGCFGIQFEAETMQEAALITRFGMNRTNEIRSGTTHASSDGKFTSHLVFGKNKRADSDIPKRR